MRSFVPGALILASLIVACEHANQGAGSKTAGAAGVTPSDTHVVVSTGNVAVATQVDTARRPVADSAAGKAKRDSTNAPAKRDTVKHVVGDSAGARVRSWPVRPVAPGAVVPAKRIVAYYGNPLSKKMGILGELPPAEMLKKLDGEIAKWRAADPGTPIQPALHLIAVVAQGGPGRDGKYRLRMTDSLINMVHGWAQQHGAILFLDVQVGRSTLQEELPRLAPFLQQPDIHLGIDAEFSMHYSSEGKVPGTKIGTFDASDVNYAVNFLADLVTKSHLPPKVLVVHRFTRPMIRNASAIKTDPRVQIVVNMDGWGPEWMKRDSYKDYVQSEPVQFTGFKLFYHNDTKKGHAMMTPEQVLSLWPKPIYIQYQ